MSNEKTLDERFDATFGELAIAIHEHGIPRHHEVKAFIHAEISLALTAHNTHILATLTERIDTIEDAKRLRETNLVSTLESYRIEDQVYGYQRAVADFRAIITDIYKPLQAEGDNK